MDKPPTVEKKDRTFHLSTHSIQWRRPKYYLKCNTSGCKRTFNHIKDWNLYHRLKHKTLIKCSICNRKFTMPSAHCAHKYTYAPARHRCGQCQCAFTFDSWLKQHKQVHVISRLHKYFFGSCKQSYKWPQDLERHIQKHMNRKWTCPDCSKTFEEERLLKRHRYKHIDIYHYKCPSCTYKSKWPTPYQRHIANCKK